MYKHQQAGGKEMVKNDFYQRQPKVKTQICTNREDGKREKEQTLEMSPICSADRTQTKPSRNIIM